MNYCRPRRPSDINHDRELDRLKKMASVNEIAIAAAMAYCAEYEMCPPPWLIAASTRLMIKLLKSEKSKKRGRAAGCIARYRQDVWDFERWATLLDIRSLRRTAEEHARALKMEDPKDRDPREVKRLEKIKAWFLHGTFACASMYLTGYNARAGSDAVKASYRRVERATGPEAFRYVKLRSNFENAVGIQRWNGSDSGTKCTRFYDLTP